MSDRDFCFAFTADPQLGCKDCFEEMDIQAEHLKRMLDTIPNQDAGWVPEFVLVGGDLTNDTLCNQWEKFRTGFDPEINNRELRFYYTTGNHDDYGGDHCNVLRTKVIIKKFISANGGNGQYPYTKRARPILPRRNVSYAFKAHGVHFISLQNDDSSMGSGTLETSLDFLSDYLTNDTNGEPVIIMMHFGFDILSVPDPPQKPWWPENERIRFLDLVYGYRYVLAVLTGHLHQRKLYLLPQRCSGAAGQEINNISGVSKNDIVDIVAGDPCGSSYYLFRVQNLSAENKTIACRQILVTENSTSILDKGSKSWPDGVPTPADNYMHFQNNTPVKIYVQITGYAGASFYKTELEPNGGTGTPYRPKNQDKDYYTTWSYWTSNAWVRKTRYVQGKNAVNIKEAKKRVVFSVLGDVQPPNENAVVQATVECF